MTQCTPPPCTTADDLLCCSSTVGNLRESLEPNIHTGLMTGQSTQYLHFKQESELHGNCASGIKSGNFGILDERWPAKVIRRFKFILECAFDPRTSWVIQGPARFFCDTLRHYWSVHGWGRIETPGTCAFNIHSIYLSIVQKHPSSEQDELLQYF